MDILKKKLSGNKLKNGLKEYMEELGSDLFKNIVKLPAISITNPNLIRICMYGNNKFLIPLDIDTDRMVIRVNGDFSPGTLVTVYVGKNGNLEYKKVVLLYDRKTLNYIIKEDSVVDHVKDYKDIKEKVMREFGMKLSIKEVDPLVKECRRLYANIDLSLEDASKRLKLSKDNFLKKVGNVSRVKDKENDVYQSFQKRIVLKYNEGWSYKEIYDYFDTGQEPVFWAIKEHNYLITNKEKLKETMLRCYCEGMDINEVNNYFKPIKRGILTKEEYLKLIREKGKTMKSKGKYQSDSRNLAVKFYREGVPLEELVHRVQDELGREIGQEVYWRSYIRILDGITKGINGQNLGNFKENHEDAWIRAREKGLVKGMFDTNI